MEVKDVVWRKYWSPEELKTVCGLANGKGGKIFIGIDEDGIVLGINNYDNQLESISTEIIRSLGLAVDIQPGKFNGKYFLEITIAESHFPVSLDGRHYLFASEECFLLSGTELQKLILNKSGKHWEDLPAINVSMDDFDVDTIQHFVTRAVGLGKLPSEASKLDRRTLMNNLGLMTTDGRFTNAAMLLFGKTTVKIAPMAGIKLFCRKDRNGPVLFQDIIEGNLFNVFTRVMELLKAKYLQCSVTGTKTEIKEYPEEIICELLLNAIIHKEYRGSYSFLRVYDDHFYLWNPADDKSPAVIWPPKEPVSYPANPTIARVFSMAGYCELAGDGITEIRKACMEKALPELVFEVGHGGLGVTLRKDVLSEELLEKYDLTERQKKALEFMKEHRRITSDRYRILTKVSRRTSTNDLSALVKLNLIKKIGSIGRGTYYKLA